MSCIRKLTYRSKLSQDHSYRLIKYKYGLSTHCKLVNLLVYLKLESLYEKKSSKIHNLLDVVDLAYCGKYQLQPIYY